MANIAKRRLRVLVAIFIFDILCYLFRIIIKAAAAHTTAVSLARDLGPQLGNMVLLYSVLGLVNGRSRRLGNNAARQVPLVCQWYCVHW